MAGSRKNAVHELWGEVRLVTQRNYRVQVNGRDYRVHVELDGQSKFQATLDGQVFQGESVTVGDTLTWAMRCGEERVRVTTKALPSNRVDAWLVGTPMQAVVQPLGYFVVSEPKAVEPVVSVIRALMPGRVTSVLVKENDRVELGTPLLLLEAMKMQNEIASPGKGHVKSIRVREGTTVKKDDVLMEIA